MSETCTEEQIIALEAIFDWIDLDNLQMQVIDAVGADWASDINSEIASLEYEVRETVRAMRREAGL